MKTKTKPTAVNGILLLNKPQGLSSNAALQQVKKLFNARKAGHTGSLDPLATGMLVICFGEATKLAPYLITTDKQYRFTLCLGQQTTTGDREGEVIAESAVPNITLTQLEKVLVQFRGDITQVPPMYSAIKYQGKPLYHYARQGITIDREARPVTIYDLAVVKMTLPTIELTVHCSKGTYVRTLAEDIGKALGSCAFVSELYRPQVGYFDESQLVTIDELTTLAEQNRLSEKLLSIPQAIQAWPRAQLNPIMASYLKNGQPIFIPHMPKDGMVQLLQNNGRLLGIGEMLPDGKIAPRKIFRTSELVA